jgi:phosphoribosylformylglycinamidine synthase
VHAIKGMGDACGKFDTPVTGGNVSFYNQNPDGAVYPTPTIGMVGVLASIKDKMTLDFKEENDLIFLIGKSTEDINSSEYLHKVHGIEFSPAPHFDIEEEFGLQQKVAELIKKKLVVSAHDVSEGGLFVALAESAFKNNLGFDVVASDYNIRKDAYWFGESQSRVVVSVKAEKIDEFKKTLGNHPYEELGFVTSGSFEVDGQDWGNVFFWKEKYDNAIANLLAVTEAEGALGTL